MEHMLSFIAFSLEKTDILNPTAFGGRVLTYKKIDMFLSFFVLLLSFSSIVLTVLFHRDKITV